MTIPTDDELDATVARLEPRLFMTLGARSRRRRVARILGGTAAAAGLVAAGLAVGVYLVPSPATSVAAIPSARPTAQPTKAPSLPSASILIRCHSTSGAVESEVRTSVAPADPAGACQSVTRSPRLSGLSSVGVACSGTAGVVDVYRSAARSATVCTRHGATAYGSGK